MQITKVNYKKNIRTIFFIYHFEEQPLEIWYKKYTFQEDRVNKENEKAIIYALKIWIYTENQGQSPEEVITKTTFFDGEEIRMFAPFSCFQENNEIEKFSIVNYIKIAQIL